MGTGFLKVTQCAKVDCSDGCTTLNILRIIDSYPLNEWIAWYVNDLNKAVT